MYRTHNKKVRLNRQGKGYEIFWVAENAEHVVKKADHESHRISLKQVEDFAAQCLFLPQPLTHGVHPKHFGFGVYRGVYYQVVAYIIRTPARRCIIETCSRVNNVNYIALCRRYDELLPRYDG